MAVGTAAPVVDTLLLELELDDAFALALMLALRVPSLLAEAERTDDKVEDVLMLTDDEPVGL